MKSYDIDVQDVEYLRHGDNRGEKAETPPVLYLQGTADFAHPKVCRDQFIDGYRKAGRRVELHFFEGVGEAFVTNDPTSPQAKDAIAKIIDFVHREIAAPLA